MKTVLITLSTLLLYSVTSAAGEKPFRKDLNETRQLKAVENQSQNYKASKLFEKNKGSQSQRQEEKVNDNWRLRDSRKGSREKDSDN